MDERKNNSDLDTFNTSREDSFSIITKSSSISSSVISKINTLNLLQDVNKEHEVRNKLLNLDKLVCKVKDNF